MMPFFVFLGLFAVLGSFIVAWSSYEKALQHGTLPSWWKTGCEWTMIGCMLATAIFVLIPLIDALLIGGGWQVFDWFFAFVVAATILMFVIVIGNIAFTPLGSPKT